MADLHGKGSTGAYYRLKTWRKLEFDEFVKRCHNLHRVYDKSVIEGVVMAVCEHIAYELGNGYMRVFNYASLTGLSYTTASRELLRIASNPSTGIISRGRKSAKLYLLAPELQKNM